MRELADNKAAVASSAFESTRKLADSIPLGQPILVGHHSERHARKDCERIDSGMRRGIEAQKAAEELERRARAAERNTSISSDDPDALDALRAKLAKMESLRDGMKRVNKEFKNGGLEGVTGISDEDREALRNQMAKPWYGPIPFPPYKLTNLGGRIRSTKERIATLESRAADVTTVHEYGDVVLRDDVDENRVQLIFPEKPGADVICALKSVGFRWSPSNQAWQRKRGNGAIAAAMAVLNKGEAR